jgi:RHS repeat-associated protein
MMVFGKPTMYNGPTQIPANVISASAYNNRFMFTGREYVSQFGIYEYRNRAYHPGLGRFMSEDPKLFDGGDYNLFRYCGNDPLDKTDPMGLMPSPAEHPEVPPNMQFDNQRAADHSRGITRAGNNPFQTARLRAENSKTYHKFGNRVAREDQEQRERLQLNTQTRRYIGAKTNDDGTMGFTTTDPELGKTGQGTDSVARESGVNSNTLYNRRNPEKNPPDVKNPFAGTPYHVVGAIVAEKRFLPNIHDKDVKRFEKAGLDAFVSYPARPPDYPNITVKFHEEHNVDP